jgi:hypothetical protein
VKDWDRLIELDTEPNSWVRRVLRAVALNRAGEHVRAMTQAEILGSDSSLPDEGIYHLATVCAQATVAVGLDQHLRTDERIKLADLYGARGVAFLRQLKNKNYFEVPANFESLQKDPGLQPLRNRSDFKQLLMEVKTKQ